MVGIKPRPRRGAAVSPEPPQGDRWGPPPSTASSVPPRDRGGTGMGPAARTTPYSAFTRARNSRLSSKRPDSTCGSGTAASSASLGRPVAAARWCWLAAQLRRSDHLAPQAEAKVCSGTVGNSFRSLTSPLQLRLRTSGRKPCNSLSRVASWVVQAPFPHRRRALPGVLTHEFVDTRI